MAADRSPEFPPVGSAPPRRAVTDGETVAAGFAMFAGVMMMTAGILQALAGFSVLVRDAFGTGAPHYAFGWDPAVWGWVHLVAGAVVAVAAWGVFAARPWARAAGIAVAGISAISNFMALPHYPFWSLLVIAFDVAVIWALALYERPGEDG
ncbi:DUF7144 family membrane protein [Actinomadura fibrosa]|uniref:DUF7144 domain-containing protein n=1 Tax=Actinomadura fibrosa TaxID=111802 RepID=A0ABW2XU95_9ACTN|nr:hypothetical protein [Actinomadura fibrosa]